jgi:hypothetical protein
LCSTAAGGTPRTTRAGQATAPNLIKELAPSGPDQIWVSDITYVATAEGWLYLAVILDLFSRRVLGWKLQDRLEASLVHQAPKRLNSASAKSWALLPFRSGCQYSSHLVRKPLGAMSSMSGLGNCYDNAKAEAFFSTLKTECFPLSNCFQSKAQARSTIFEYLEMYYNNQRLHSALGYQSPRQYESGYQSEKEPIFQKKKLHYPFCRRWSEGQGSKRNKCTGYPQYVVAHELAHLIERHHNERFFAIMDRHMPRWRLHRQELNSAPVANETWDC